MSDYDTVAGACPPADLTHDPDGVTRIPFHWAVRLNGDTIDTSTFLLPDGLTEDDTDQAGSLTTIDVSGGTEGQSYRVTNRVVTDGGLTMDWTKRVLVREQ